MVGPPSGAPASRMRVPGPRTAAVLLLCVAVLACFPRVLSSDWIFFSRDIHAYWYPMVSTFVRVVADGGLPLWDPYESFGLPLWADPGSQVVYPLTWLNLLLFPPTVYKMMVLGHLMAAGLGLLALMRRWGLGVVPSLAAAIAFACSGPLVSAGSLVHHLCGAAYLPWVLRAFEDVLERGSRRDVAMLALVLGTQALAGSAEMCAMSGLLALLRWLTLAAGRWGNAVRRIAPVAIAAGIGALLAAIQWLPTLSIVSRTNRGHFPLDYRLLRSVHPASLLDTMLPRFLSEMPMGPALVQTVFGSLQPFLPSLYLGVATVPLVLLSLGSRRPQRAWALVSFVLFLALSLGRHFPPAGTVLSLPPLSYFRYPSKYMLPAALAWSVLAGLGLEVWWRRWSRRDRRHGLRVALVLVALAVALALAASTLRRNPQPLLDALHVDASSRQVAAHVVAHKVQACAAWLSAASLLALLRAGRPHWARPSALLVLVVAAADLVVAARPVNPLAPKELLAHRPPLVDHVLPDATRTRVLSTAGRVSGLNRDLTRGPAGWTPEWKWALGVQDSIAAPVGSRWGLRGSYDGDFTGIAAPGLPLMTSLMARADRSPVGLRLLQVGNVGWVIDPRPDAFAKLPVTTHALSVFTHPITLRRVPDPLPPAYVVGGATRIASDGEALARVVSSEFDPRREVVLAGPGPAQEAPAGFQGSARYLSRGASRLQIETVTNGPGVLVAVEAYDADWRATVDGAPAALERANVIFRAVAVPAGRHVVELRYFPRSIAWGLAASALGLVCAAGLHWSSRPRRTSASLPVRHAKAR